MCKEESAKNANHKALPRAKNEIKQLENTVDRRGRKISKLETKIERLEKENEKLKQELKSHNKPPKWAKANKNKNPDGSLLKKES